MRNRLFAAAHILFDTAAAGRSVTTRDDDRFIVSYPKSGNTWMRFLLANLNDEEVGFGSIESTIPDIYQNRDSRIARLSSPRLIKSHEYFDPRYARAVYIVRDPRDVAVSYFHHHKKFPNRNSALSLTEFVDAFLEGRLDKFGSWSQNVGSWIGACGGDSRFMLIRYEDLKRDTHDVLAEVVDHLDIDADERRIDTSISRCQFNNMHRMERQQGEKWRVLNGTRQDLAFVRKGEVGAWKEVLSSIDRRKIEARYHSLMQDLDYL